MKKRKEKEKERKRKEKERKKEKNKYEKGIGRKKNPFTLYLFISNLGGA